MPAPNKKGGAHALSADDIAILKQAAHAQRNLSQLGAVGIAPPEQKIKAPTPTPALEPVQPQAPLSKQVVRETTQTVQSTNFENFIEIEGLPSKGLFYEQKLQGQPLKVQDLIQIQGVDASNVNSRFDQIFSRRIRGINAQEILMCDELFLSFWLRANSFPGYHFPNLPYVCEECQYEVKEREADFDFLNMKFNVENLEACKTAFGNNSSIDIALPSGKIVKLYMRRRGHTTMAREYIDEMYTKHNTEPDEETENLIFMSAILDFGSDQSIAQTISTMEQLDVMDFLFLVKEMNKYSLYEVPEVGYVCPNCKSVTLTSEYPFRPEIFLPTIQ